MTFLKIKRVIDRWDPVNLLTIGCPLDEYDFEIKKILESCAFNSIDELSKIIYDVFIDSFGSDIFSKNQMIVKKLQVNY